MSTELFELQQELEAMKADKDLDPEVKKGEMRRIRRLIRQARKLEQASRDDVDIIGEVKAKTPRKPRRKSKAAAAVPDTYFDDLMAEIGTRLEDKRDFDPFDYVYGFSEALIVQTVSEQPDFLDVSEMADAIFARFKHRWDSDPTWYTVYEEGANRVLGFGPVTVSIGW